MTERLPDRERPQTDEEWKGKLSAEKYRVLRESGTGPCFSSGLLDVDIGRWSPQQVAEFDR